MASGKLGSLLVSLYIEYYEVKTANGYEYYFMPVDTEAKHKENMDSRSHRIWRMNKRTHKFETIKDIRKNAPEMTADELFSILFSGKPVPYDDYYLILEEVKQYREAKESSTLAPTKKSSV